MSARAPGPGWPCREALHVGGSPGPMRGAHGWVLHLVDRATQGVREHFGRGQGAAPQPTSRRKATEPIRSPRRLIVEVHEIAPDLDRVALAPDAPLRVRQVTLERDGPIYRSGRGAAGLPLAGRLQDATRTASSANERAALTVPFIPRPWCPRQSERRTDTHVFTVLTERFEGTKSWSPRAKGRRTGTTRSRLDEGAGAFAARRIFAGLVAP